MVQKNQPRGSGEGGRGGAGQARLEWGGWGQRMLNSAQQIKREENGSSLNSWQKQRSNFRVRFHRGRSGLVELGVLNFTELPSLCWVRAVKGGKKYLRRHYSSLAVCMSARYPRLGQNTPLVQRRERKGKEIV